jgi:Flp pilus assembly protein TadG
MHVRSERGTATLEFAMVLPILLILVLALVQVGLIVRDQLVLVGAARAGAREAVVTPDDDRVRSVTAAAAPGIDASTMVVSINRTGRGDPASVSIDYRESLRVPFVDWLFPSSVTLRASASMRQEFG